MARKSKAKGAGKIFLTAKNSTQKDYIQSIINNELTLVDGPAGTGKSFIAAMMAAKMYDEGHVTRIILSRPNIPSSKSIGFFPGTLEEKMEPWVAPIFNTFLEVLPKGVIDTGIKNKRIEIVPFEVMRGRSFEDAFIILDEAQNVSYHEMKMFLTRLGENCTTIVNGDTDQSDLRDTKESGLEAAFRLGKKIPGGLGMIHFSEDDIVRSGMCAHWVKAFRND